MCWACEEEAMFFRYQLELAVARGEIAPGLEPADFEAAGLPVPGQAEPARSQTASPDVSAASPASPFTCDSPDRQ